MVTGRRRKNCGRTNQEEGNDWTVKKKVIKNKINIFSNEQTNKQ